VTIAMMNLILILLISAIHFSLCFMIKVSNMHRHEYTDLCLRIAKQHCELSKTAIKVRPIIFVGVIFDNTQVNFVSRELSLIGWT